MIRIPKQMHDNFERISSDGLNGLFIINFVNTKCQYDFTCMLIKL